MQNHKIQQNGVMEMRMLQVIEALDPIDHAAAQISGGISDLLAAAHATRDAGRLNQIYETVRALDKELAAATHRIGEWSDVCLWLCDLRPFGYGHEV